MAILGSAIYELRTDNSKFNRGMNEAQKTSAEKAKAISQNLRNVGLGLVGLGTAILGPLGLATKEASNLEESINAVNVVFGEGASTILEFGQNASTQVGLARSEFNQLATQTGSLLTNFGFTQDQAAEKTIELTRRAADLASVHNTDVKDALSAINQALRGETEAIRRYAADVTDATIQAYLNAQGIDAQVTAMSQAEKAQLRLQVLMEQTAIVQDDFANTSDSAANQMRILRAQITDAGAEIGTALLPVVQDLLGYLGPIVTNVANWAKENPTLTKALVIGAGVVGVLAIALGTLALGISAVTTVLPAFGAAFTFATGPIGLIVLAITAAIAIGVLLWKRWDWVKEQVGNIWQLIGQYVEDGVNWVIRAINFVTLPYRTFVKTLLDGAGVVAAAFGQELPESVTKFRDALDDGIPEVDIFTKRVEDEAVAAEEATDANTDLATAIEDVGTAAEETGEKMMTAQQLTVANQRVAVEEFKQLYRDQTLAAIQAMEDRALAEANEDERLRLLKEHRFQLIVDSLRKEQEAITGANQARLELLQEANDAEFAESQAATAAMEAAEEARLAELERQTNERIRLQEREAAEQQRNLDAMQRGWDGYVQSQHETILAIREAGITFTDIVNRMAEDAGLTAAEIAARMMEMGVQFGDVMGLIDKAGTEAIEGLIADFKKAQGATSAPVGGGGGGGAGGDGGQKRDNSLVGNAFRTLRLAQRAIRSDGELNRFQAARLASAIRYLIRTGDLSGVPDWAEGHIPALAKGGIVASPTLAMVGERGPEAVIPLSDLPMAGRMGGAPVIQFLGDVRGVDEEMVADMVEVAYRTGRLDPARRAGG